jgi:UDP-N-acetylmuramyl pentapeptide phosphotransferase/UDP-N-acetylglucosamine-1-phosphate transferase
VTTTLVVVGVVATATALVATPVAMAVARRLDVVDHPAPLKPQRVPVPYLGGAAVFVAAIVGGAVGRPLLLLPLGLVLVLGVADDIVGLPPGHAWPDRRRWGPSWPLSSPPTCPAPWAPSSSSW